MPTKPPEVVATLRRRDQEYVRRLHQLTVEQGRLRQRLSEPGSGGHSLNRTLLEGSLQLLRRQLAELQSERRRLAHRLQHLAPGDAWARQRLSGEVVPTPRRDLHHCPRCAQTLASVHHETKMVCACGWSEASTFRTEGGTGDQNDYYDDQHVGVDLQPEDLAQVGSVTEGHEVDRAVASPSVAPAPTEPYCALMRQWQAQQMPEHVLKQLADQYRKYCHVADPFCVQTVLTKTYAARLHLSTELRQASERLSRELRGDAMPAFTEAEIQQFRADAEHFPPSVYQALQPNQVVGIFGRRLGLEQARLLTLGRTEDPIRPKVREAELAYSQHWAEARAAAQATALMGVDS